MRTGGDQSFKECPQGRLDRDPDEARTSVRASVRPSEIFRHNRERFDYTEGFDDCQWMYNRGLTPRLNREVPRLKAAES